MFRYPETVFLNMEYVIISLRLKERISYVNTCLYVYHRRKGIFYTILSFLFGKLCKILRRSHPLE